MRHLPTQSSSIAVEQILVSGEGARVSILPERGVAFNIVRNYKLSEN